MVNLKKIKFVESNIYWIVGFVDGEGCFHISFNKKSSMPCGLEVRPSFSISQKAHSLQSLENIKDFFNCGGIRFDRRDGTFKFEVRSIKDIKECILPFFSKYELLTKKSYDFETFKKICIMILEGQHLNILGLTEIIELSYTMNGSGKRKYTKEELLTFINKLKR